MRKILQGRRATGRGPFIMRVDTRTQDAYATGYTPSATNQFYFPIYNGADNMGYSVGFTIDWGDGTTSEVNSSNYATECLHTYAGPGIYTIKAEGAIGGFNFWALSQTNGKSDGKKLLEIERWGDLKLTGGAGNPGSGPPPSYTKIGQIFRNCQNLATVSAEDTPWIPLSPTGGNNTNGVRWLFGFCYGLVTINNIKLWDVSACKTLTNTFYSCNKWEYGTNAGGIIDLSLWDVSDVTTFASTFGNCSLFNGIIFKNVGVDVSAAQSFQFRSVFQNCLDFNPTSGNMSTWDMSRCTDLSYAFKGASLFNEDISMWNTSNVQTMRETFKNAITFNQTIGNWDVSNVTDMRQMLGNASSFNHNISSWNVDGWTSGATADLPIASTSGNFTLSTLNYDLLLVAWDAYNFANYVGNAADFGTSTYSLSDPAVVTARNNLIAKWGNILDGGGV